MDVDALAVEGLLGEAPAQVVSGHDDGVVVPLALADDEGDGVVAQVARQDDRGLGGVGEASELDERFAELGLVASSDG